MTISRIKDFLEEYDLYDCTDIEDLLNAIDYGWDFKDTLLSIANYYGLDVEDCYNAIDTNSLMELWNGDIEECINWLDSEHGLEEVFYEDRTYLLQGGDVEIFSEMCMELEQEEERGGRSYGGLI